MEEHEKQQPSLREAGSGQVGLAETQPARAGSSSATTPAAATTPATPGGSDEVVTESTRRAVWRGLIESDQLQRYYGGLAGKLLRRSRYGVWIAAGLGLAAAACFALGWHAAGGVCAALAACVNVWLGVSDAGDRVITEAHRENRLGALQGEWLALWERIEAGEPIENREVLDRCRKLHEEERAITLGARREVDRKLWESSQTEARKYRPGATLPEPS